MDGYEQQMEEYDENWKNVGEKWKNFHGRKIWVKKSEKKMDENGSK